MLPQPLFTFVKWFGLLGSLLLSDLKTLALSPSPNVLTHDFGCEKCNVCAVLIRAYGFIYSFVGFIWRSWKAAPIFLASSNFLRSRPADQGL
jgi:hypothetical protein